MKIGKGLPVLPKINITDYFQNSKNIQHLTKMVFYEK